MADDLERLVASFDANISAYEKKMDRMGVVFDRQAKAISAKNEAMVSRMNKSWGGLKIGSFAGTLAGGAVVVGIERFVSGVVEMSGKIQDAADVLKVGTDELQAWGIIAGRNGMAQEDLNGAIEKFGKNLGEAALHGGQARKELDALGVNVKGSVTDAFYKLADAVAKTKDKQQQTAIVTGLFGKSAAGLVPVLAQGSAALKQQQVEFQRNGSIISREAIAKIDDLGDKWGDLKRKMQAIGGNILGGFLETFGDFTKDMESTVFQSALNNFGRVMGQVAKASAAAAPYLPALTGAFIGARIAGPGGAVVGAAFGSSIGGNGIIPKGTTLDQRQQLEMDIARLNKTISDRPMLESIFGDSASTKKARAEVALLQKQLEKLAKTASPGKPDGGTEGGDQGNGTDRNFDFAGNEKSLENRRRALEALARNATERASDARSQEMDASEARRDAIRAQDDALLTDAQGTKDYEAIHREVIDELAKLDIETIAERRDADIAADKDRTDAALRSLDDLKARGGLKQSEYAAESEAIEQHHQDAILQIQNTAQARADAVEAKRRQDQRAADEQEQQRKANQIALNDEIRQGLEDMALAGLHGFGSMKSAAAEFLEQLAQMILKLYVIGPLLDAVLGKSGTSGGGILGQLFKAGVGALFGGGGGFSSLSNTLAGNAGYSLASIPAKIPGFAGGTNYAPGGLAKVGEHGPELVNLPRGSQVISSLNTRGMLAAAASAAAFRPSFTVVVHQSLAGAIGVDGIRDIARGQAQAMGAEVGRQVQRQFPALMAKAQRDNF